MVDFGNTLRPDILREINFEVFQSVSKHREHAMLNPALTLGERLAILVEEVGEVATAMNYDNRGKGGSLYQELLQVAAMAASWAQVIIDGDSNKSI